MNSPKISILLPFRNEALYLKECLESIQLQTESDFEVIGIDNFSEDKSADIFRGMGDSRFKYLKTDHLLKIPESLKTGLSNSTGTYVTRMDADDLMPSNKIEVLCSMLRSTEYEVSTGCVEYFSDTEVKGGFKRYEAWLNQTIKEQNFYSEIYKECILPSPCWMMKRETLDRIGGFEETIIPEDYDLAFRCYANNLKIIGSNHVLHKWRDHESRNSRNDPDYDDQNFFELKLKYFFELDRDLEKELVVLGVGNKSKELVKLLIEDQVNFTWASGDSNKIGQNIYDKIIESKDNVLIPGNQFIVSISGPVDVLKLKKQAKDLDLLEDFFFFY